MSRFALQSQNTDMILLDLPPEMLRLIVSACLQDVDGGRSATMFMICSKKVKACVDDMAWELKNAYRNTWTCSLVVKFDLCNEAFKTSFFCTPRGHRFKLFIFPGGNSEPNHVSAYLEATLDAGEYRETTFLITCENDEFREDKNVPSHMFTNKSLDTTWIEDWGFRQLIRRMDEGTTYRLAVSVYVHSQMPASLAREIPFSL